MKILRYQLLLLVLTISLLPVTAQIKFGVKGGVNIANVNIDNPALENVFDVENITGFQLGPVMEAILPAIGIGGDIGLLYSQRGFKLKNKTDGENANTRIGYIDIPVNLKWKPGIGPLKLYLAAGPYISFKISQNIDLKDLSNYQQFFDDTFKTSSFSAGLNFGFGFEVFKHLQIGANYALGLTDDYKHDPVGLANVFKPKSTTWSVTAAYYF